MTPASLFIVQLSDDADLEAAQLAVWLDLDPPDGWAALVEHDHLYEFLDAVGGRYKSIELWSGESFGDSVMGSVRAAEFGVLECDIDPVCPVCGWKSKEDWNPPAGWKVKGWSSAPAAQ
jgi:hypothetical protein